MWLIHIIYASATAASSRIDHFFVTSTLADNILECSIVDNLLYSDHTPLKLKLYLSLDHASFTERAYCDRVAVCQQVKLITLLTS